MLKRPHARIPEAHHPSDGIAPHPSTATDSDPRADGALHCNTALRNAAAAHRPPLSRSLCANVPLPPIVLSQSRRCVPSLSALPRHCALEPPLNRSSDRSTPAATAIIFPAHAHTTTAPCNRSNLHLCAYDPTFTRFPLLLSFSVLCCALSPSSAERSSPQSGKDRVTIFFPSAGEGVSDLLADWNRSSWRRRLTELLRIKPD